MMYPFKIIDSKIAKRDEFKMTDGYQPTCALFYLKEGNFRLCIGEKDEDIRAGDCVILPDYIHFHRNVVDPIVFVYIKFAYDTRCPFYLELPYGRIDVQNKERFLSSIEAYESLPDSDDARAVCYREHLLRDILFQIYFEQNKEELPIEEKEYRDHILSAAVSWIRENIDKKIVIEDICRVIGTNASTLNFKFRREAKMSVGQYITEERMRVARRLLGASTYSISDIATRCGFENVYYFSTAFKKYHGVSPKTYRECRF